MEGRGKERARRKEESRRRGTCERRDKRLQMLAGGGVGCLIRFEAVASVGMGWWVYVVQKCRAEDRHHGTHSYVSEKNADKFRVQINVITPSICVGTSSKCTRFFFESCWDARTFAQPGTAPEKYSCIKQIRLNLMRLSLDFFDHT